MCGIAGIVGRKDASCDPLGHLRADKRGAQTWALLLLEEWCRTNV